MYPSTSINGLNNGENGRSNILLLNPNPNQTNDINMGRQMLSELAMPAGTITTMTNDANNDAASTASNGSKKSGLSNGGGLMKSSTNGLMKTSGPYSGSKRKKQEKSGKGLRHFSTKVCEKVRSKGTTTYNEVADELVAEFSADPAASRQYRTGNDQEPFDQKNIRRRVYDALNVLMAINIISKEKKEIKWIGLPSNAINEYNEVEHDLLERIERIERKKRQLRELLIQQIAFKNLIDRNQNSENPDPNSIIKLPFIIVNTDKNTLIDCSISRDKSEYLFNFGSTFEIHDDFEVMKRMGLAYNLEKLENGQTLRRTDYERARQFLPEALRPELDEMLAEKHVQLIN